MDPDSRYYHSGALESLHKKKCRLNPNSCYNMCSWFFPKGKIKYELKSFKSAGDRDSSVGGLGAYLAGTRPWIQSWHHKKKKNGVTYICRCGGSCGGGSHPGYRLQWTFPVPFCLQSASVCFSSPTVTLLMLLLFTKLANKEALWGFRLIPPLFASLCILCRIGRVGLCSSWHVETRGISMGGYRIETQALLGW